MKTVKVECDGCGADLTTRSNSVDYRLVLASEGKPGYGTGFYTAMMIYPALDRDHHFCDLTCLDHWRAREKRYGAEMAEHWKAWKAEHGRDFGNGMSSYPEPPEETRKAWASESRSTALETFPIARP